MTPKKSSGPNNGIRCKNAMYEQQIEYLPFPLDELEARIKRLNPVRYAFIIHDRDINKDGTPAKPHVHVMSCFRNARYLTSIAKMLGEKPQFIKAWDKRANNGFAYCSILQTVLEARLSTTPAK